MFMQDMTLVRQDRTRSGGGVVTYIRNNLKPNHLASIQENAKLNGIETTVSTIQIQNEKKQNLVVIMGVYRPPSSKAAWFTAFNDLSLLLSISNIGHLVILGDLNCDLLKPDTYPGKDLLDSMALAGLQVYMVELAPTRITSTSATCLDLIMIDKNLECTKYLTLNNAASDHFPVSASISAVPTSDLQPVIKRSFKHVDFVKLAESCSLINIDNIDVFETNSMVEKWYKEMINILDDVAPLRSFPARTNKCPWVTPHIKELIHHRDWLAKKQNLNKDSANISKKLRIAKRKVTSNIRRQMKSLGSKALDIHDHRGAWSFIKAATFTENKARDHHHELEALNDYFGATVSIKDNYPSQMIHSCDTNEAFQFKPMSTRQTDQLLKNIKINTATGCDELPAFLLKQLASSLAHNLTLIFNSSISSSTFPLVWKQSNICPVWKGKGSRSEPSNYRPISVISVVARVFEKALARQLQEYCDHKCIIPKEQFGFRRNSSCEAALLSAMESWLSSVDAGNFVGALAIDLSKAFDTVLSSTRIAQYWMWW